jgi:hypothetical protein
MSAIAKVDSWRMLLEAVPGLTLVTQRFFVRNLEEV